MSSRDLPVVRGRSSRIEELDGLRGIAVLMVLAWHFVGAIIETDLGWWASAIRNIVILGRTGVDLFFVLSGYLITRILLARTQRDSAFLAIFYAKRILRIFPLYFLLVGVFWSVVWLSTNNSVFNGDTPLWRHLSFTQNFWMSDSTSWGPGGISVTWSVAIEEQYYLVFPLLVLALPRRWLPGAHYALSLWPRSCAGPGCMRCNQTTPFCHM